MKVTLKKIKSNHDNLALDAYRGFADTLPTIGESFTMQGTEEGRVWTTPVQAYTKNFDTNSISFKTKNSEYLLLLGDK